MSILEKARLQSQISTSDLINLVYVSKDRYNKLLKCLKGMEKDLPQNESLMYYEKSRLKQIKHAYTILSKEMIARRAGTDYENAPEELYYAHNILMPGAVSILMVRHIINVVGTDEQREKWLPLLDTYRYIGAYAQTELAHGSDVQNLETEAVYDEKTDELVINNKTVSSYKWWPGELGHLANIAIVYAKTIVNDKNLGVLPILVELRDYETHKVLPGVEVGDIGPKFGYSEKENGYLRFSNYRVPRSNLLSRFIDFKLDGQLITKGNPKIMYASMMNVRIALLHSSSYHLGKALAITVRYSHIRSQFKDQSFTEVPIIDYQLQQHKLIPLIAKTYAMMCGFTQIRKVIQHIEQDIKKSDFSKLQEGHILLSGGKAVYTAWCNSGLVTCLQACGGHGFSHFSGIPMLIQGFLPNTILEGENAILLLQVGRYLLKAMGKILRGRVDKITPQIQYLLNSEYYDNLTVENTEDFLSNPKNIMDLLSKGVFSAIKHALEHMMQFADKNNVLEVFNKKSAIRVIEAAKLHTLLFTFEYFLKSIEDLESENSKLALTNLAVFFAIDQLIENAQLYSALDVLNSEVLITIKSLYEKLLTKIKPDILTLSEIYALDDNMLYSALGHQNEKPYENLFRMAKEVGTMNKVDLTDYYLNTIRKASLYAYPKL